MNYIKNTFDKFTPKFNDIQIEDIQKFINQLNNLLRFIPKSETSNLNIAEIKILLKEFCNICTLAQNFTKDNTK